ncbi:MAG: glycosyltransferase [Gammaproteobacteria bacterium]|nr:glycosyltransferase [Gammaproteobacteria bacterium]
MKVLHVETGQNLWGGAQQVLYLIQGLGRLGVSNVLACTEGGAVSENAPNDCLVVAMPMAGDLDLAFIGRLRKIIKSERPDLVHVHSRRGADPLAAIAARLRRVPVVVSRRVDNAEQPWVARLKYRLYKKVITVAGGISEVLLAEGVSADRLRLVHSGVDRRRFKPDPDRDWMAANLGIEKNTIIIAMVAQYIHRKGHRIMLDALPSVLEKYPDLQVLCCGSGPNEDALAVLIGRRGLADQVRMLGFRDDLEKILPCCTMALHPALTEGICGAALQAQSCGVPVIASRVGGLPEAVAEDVSGLLVDPGDVEQLSQAMLRLLDDDALRQSLGDAGPGHVAGRFSISAMVQGNLEVYKEVLNRH